MSWNLILCLWLLRIWFIFLLSLALKYSKKCREIRGGSQTVGCGGQWVKIDAIDGKKWVRFVAKQQDSATLIYDLSTMKGTVASYLK